MPWPKLDEEVTIVTLCREGRPWQGIGDTNVALSARCSIFGAGAHHPHPLEALVAAGMDQRHQHRR